jgi:predicted nucleic acid-binding Zn ribbon protein
MNSIQNLAGGVVAEIIRRQPASPARTSFAWQLVVGPALARVTSVDLDGTTLRVSASDRRWLGEIQRARAVILPKLQQLLGADAVAKISIRT